MQVLSLLLGCLAALPPQGADGASERPKNVLLFTLDTTRADHLGCYGHGAARTAAIDALAKRGVLFEQARTPVPMTLPAHTTIMTGFLPCEHLVRDNGRFRLWKEAPTLAHTLKVQGFDTAAFVGAYVLDASYGLDNGFDVYQGVKSKSIASTFEERPATAVTRDVLAWLDGRESNRPFFAWVHYFDPHAPYRSPLEQDGLPPYDAEIAFVSEHIQVVLDHLGMKLAETLVVVTADHGEGLGEHGEDSHGFFLYASTMRVPLIFTHPSLAGGRRVAASVGLQDIARTICEVLGQAPDPALGGRSLA